MRALIGLLLIAIPIWPQNRDTLGNRSLRGPSIWVMDNNGRFAVADLDTTTLILDPPGTVGGRYVLRAIQQVASALKMRVLTLSYQGLPLSLPDTPAANTSPIVFWGATFQEPVNYTTVGRTLTMIGNGWQVGDNLTVIYFY